MLKEIGNTNRKNRMVNIIDARSKMAAYGNSAKGGGYENDKFYTNCKVEFGEIDNIHAVRTAYAKCFSLCENYYQLRDSKKIMSKIEESGWANLLRNLLYMSSRVADYVTVRCHNVLVHCSDGWDRTAEICSLAEIMIDPYYRTLEGFEVIIEKEWVSFGHKFHHR